MDAVLLKIHHGSWWRKWSFPMSSNYIACNPLGIPYVSWLVIRCSLKRIHGGVGFSFFFWFKFLQLSSSRGAPRGHWKWAISSSLVGGLTDTLQKTVVQRSSKTISLCGNEQGNHSFASDLWKGSPKIHFSCRSFLPHFFLQPYALNIGINVEILSGEY